MEEEFFSFLMDYLLVNCEISCSEFLGFYDLSLVNCRKARFLVKYLKMDCRVAFLNSLYGKKFGHETQKLDSCNLYKGQKKIFGKTYRYSLFKPFFVEIFLKFKCAVKTEGKTTNQGAFKEKSDSAGFQLRQKEILPTSDGFSFHVNSACCHRYMATYFYFYLTYFFFNSALVFQFSGV